MPVAISIEWKPLRDSHYVVASLQPGGGGLRQIFVRQSTLNEVQALVRRDPDQSLVGLLLGERLDCSLTLKPYVLIESHVEVALASLDERSISGAIRTLHEHVRGHRSVEVLGWYCSGQSAGVGVSRTLAAVHAACFAEPWQTVLTFGDSGSAGAFFLDDPRAARWFHAPFFELTGSDASSRAPRPTSVAWPAYLTTSSVVPLAASPQPVPPPKQGSVAAPVSPPVREPAGVFARRVVTVRRTPAGGAPVGVRRDAAPPSNSALDLAKTLGDRVFGAARHATDGIARIRAKWAASAAQRKTEADAARVREEERLAREAARRRAAREEEQRRAAEVEKRRAADAEARRVAEAEARQKATEEAERRRATEAEARRQAAEAEARRRAEEAEAEARRRVVEAEAEARRRAAEAEARRAAEAEAQRKAAEEAQRKAAETEARRKAAEEAQRKAAEEEQRRAAEAAVRRQAAEADARRQAAEAEARRLAEAETEARRRAEEAEARRAAEAEAQRKAAEQARREAAEMEARRKAAEEAQRKSAEEEQRRAAEAALHRQAAEAEARRQAAEAEARRQAEAAEARRQAAEAEARRLAEAEAEARRQAAEAEARRLAEVEAQRLAAEAAARRQTEEADAEARRKVAEAEADAKRKAAETEEASRRRAAESEALRISVEVAAIRGRLARAPVEGSRREAPKMSAAQMAEFEDTAASDGPYRYLALAGREGFEVSEKIDRGTREHPETVWLLYERESGLRLIVVTTDEGVREASLHYNLRTDDDSLLRITAPEHRHLESRTIYGREACLHDLRARVRRLRATGALERDWKVSPTFQHPVSG